MFSKAFTRGTKIVSNCGIWNYDYVELLDVNCISTVFTLFTISIFIT